MTNVRPAIRLHPFEKLAYTLASLAMVRTCWAAIFTETPQLEPFARTMGVVMLGAGVAFWFYMAVRVWRSDK